MMKCTNINCCLTFFGVVILGVAAGSSYTKGLIKYLRRESRLHQVMFITDDHLLQNSSSSADYLIRDVSHHFPSFSTSFSTLNESLHKHFPPSARPPRRTTLFIMILNGDQGGSWFKLVSALMQLKQLSQGHSYPKCLINIISQKESQSIKEILEYFWSLDFLDIAVLQHLRENETSMESGDGRLPVLHKINLFAKIYTANKVSAKTKWFPNKLLNLHGYEVRFGLGFLKYNDNKEHFKSHLRFAGIFSKTMHCFLKIQEIPSLDEHSLYETVYQQKLEMFLNLRQFVISESLSSKKPLIRIVDFRNGKAVIPITLKFTRVIVISREFIYMLVSTTVVIVTIRITAWILKFNRKTWQLFNISRIIMGMSVTREPAKTVERIVFGIFLLSCIVYSSYFYSVILDISLQAEPQISNLEELANSSLTPLGSPLSIKSILESPIYYIRKLGTKANYTSIVNTDNECLAYLTKFANVTCITNDIIVSKFKKHSEYSGRILQEPVSYFIVSWFARDGSPFLDRFNEVILKASEHGLLHPALHENNKQPNRPSSPEEISKEKLLMIVCYLLVIGYSVAVLSFIMEIMSVVNWQRKVNAFYHRCCNCMK